MVSTSLGFGERALGELVMACFIYVSAFWVVGPSGVTGQLGRRVTSKNMFGLLRCGAAPVLPFSPRLQPSPLSQRAGAYEALPKGASIVRAYAIITWKDQGWGNRKGACRVTLMRGTEAIKTFSMFGIAHHARRSGSKTPLKLPSSSVMICSNAALKSAISIAFNNYKR